jgi:hypothetical protein
MPLGGRVVVRVLFSPKLVAALKDCVISPDVLEGFRSFEVTVESLGNSGDTGAAEEP